MTQTVMAFSNLIWKKKLGKIKLWFKYNNIICLYTYIYKKDKVSLQTDL